MERRRFVESLRSAGQVVAIVALMAYAALLLYKGSGDLRALEEAHPGSEFWPALGRHFLHVLGGG